MTRELQILVLMLAIGAVLGVLSARWAADHPALAGAVRSGAWQSWPEAGVEGAIPYARLRYYLDGALPPSPMDRLEMMADTDDDGNLLARVCTYELNGPMLPVRTWMISTHDLANDVVAQAVLHAEDAIYEPDGRLRIILSNKPYPGNWLPMPATGRVRVVLHLFGISPLERERILKMKPFTIRRMRCS